MRVLLDTCAILWLGTKQPSLSPATLELLTAEDTEVCVSVVSILELACLQARQRVGLGKPWQEWWDDLLAANGWTCLPITPAIARAAYLLPEPFHRDPADRLLAATARIEDMPLVTGDHLLLGYAHISTLR